MGCFAGFVTAIVMISSLIAYSDISVNSVESRLERAYSQCELANSVPLSYDRFTVTCENGAKMSMKKEES